MKKIFTLLSLFVSITSFSQIYYDFSTAEPTGTPAGLAADTVVNGNVNGVTPVRTSVSASTGYAGASGTLNAGAATRLNGLDKDTSTYFEFSITPANGFLVVVSSITFGTRSTSTGPQAYSIRSNTDNYNTDASTGAITNNSTWTLISPTLTPLVGNLNSTLVIRIYGYGGAGSPGINTANWRIDDLTINAVATSLQPLNLTSFNAALVNGSALLNWRTSNEVNVKDFTIERSTDAVKFSVVGSVKATNRSEAMYSFTDAATMTGVNFYRLRMTDADGTVKISKVVMISNNLTTTLFPNPVVNNVVVNHTKAAAGSTIRITNLQGQTMKVYNVEQGATQSSLDVNALGKGTYVLIYQNGTARSISKFIK